MASVAIADYPVNQCDATARVCSTSPSTVKCSRVLISIFSRNGTTGAISELTRYVSVTLPSFCSRRGAPSQASSASWTPSITGPIAPAFN